jgi:hypothetical protein
MPNFQITVVNDPFDSTSEAELDDIGAAKLSALKGALELGVEQILGGAPVFGAEVIVGDGNARQRFIVAIATSPLK